MHGVASSHQTANLNLQPVVEEPLGELERIVGGLLTCAGDGVLDAEADVDGLQCRACNVVDFALQEGVQSGVHGEVTRASAIQIHACSQHGYRQFASLLITHGVQLCVDLCILGCLDDELESHVVEGLGDLYTTIEGHTPGGTALIAHSGFRVLCGCDVQLRIHRIASKLYVTAFRYGKGLQRNDGQ